jgi:large subunit ribosomal protein L13
VRTYSAKPGEVPRQWYVVDADGEVLGRLASRIATILRGKHKPYFTPHVDTGDFVIVVNAEKVHLTGNKLDAKQYYHHSGYPGGLRSLWYEKLLEVHPERAIEKAVWGMLPKNSLGRKLLRKLKVYRGPDHPHGAQNPEQLAAGATPVPAAHEPGVLPPPPKRRPKPKRPPKAKPKVVDEAAEETKPKRRTRRTKPQAETGAKAELDAAEAPVEPEEQAEAEAQPEAPVEPEAQPEAEAEAQPEAEAAEQTEEPAAAETPAEAEPSKEG